MDKSEIILLIKITVPIIDGRINKFRKKYLTSTISFTKLTSICYCSDINAVTSGGDFYILRN